MPKNRQGSFTIIKGGGADASPSRATLQVVDAVPRRVPIQLRLPYRGALHSFVVSVGFDGLTFEKFSSILCTYQIKYVIDIRISPLFRGKGFSNEVVEHELLLRDISYIHFPQASNPFVDENFEQSVLVTKYAQYLEGRKDIVEAIIKIMLEGPILLLSWTSKHKNSERDVLINSIAQIRDDFDLMIL